ncbi:MAG TPA: DUF3298 and DUF4163 domain-containing protein [Cyclobacteriaceae bacterium]|nr:DUF3298 and DUF4163 domain-containing protein [Cyclobacteriaceae bacterium]
MTKLFSWVVICFLLACHSPSTTESFPPAHREQRDNFQECVGEGCATVELIYPVFAGDTRLAGLLNRQVEGQHLRMWISGDQQYREMEEAIDSFFKDYRVFRNDYPQVMQEWTFETNARVTHQSDSLISIRFENFSYLGGAHPNTVVAYLNLKGDGEVLERGQLLIDGEGLLELAREKFKEHHQVEPGTRLEEDGRFFLDDGAFFLPATMGYEGNEFVLLYNAYEIGPYVMGRTELRFPLKELAGVVYSGGPG